jgi:hypothetical protein
MQIKTPRIATGRKILQYFSKTGKSNIKMRNFISLSKASATLYLLRSCFFQHQHFGLGSAIFNTQLKLGVQTNLVVV